jgi:hypothetical protein
MTDPDTVIRIIGCVFSSILLENGYGAGVGLYVSTSGTPPELLDFFHVDI